MSVMKWLTPWWANTPDPEVSPIEERERALKQQIIRDEEASKLRRFMEVERNNNNFKARMYAGYFMKGKR